MIYFYARVSSKDQNLDRQLEAAKAFKEIDRVFSDKQSGKNFDRPEYIALKAVVRTGDEVIIKELDRLGRNKDGIKEEIKWFKEHGVILRILDVPTTLIDFQGQDWIADMVNNILIEVLGAIAQNEREKTHKRQREGIDAMRVVDGKKISAKTGRAYGRQTISVSDDFEKFLKKQKDGLMTFEECCKELGIGRTTWYARVQEVAV
ncbi:MAG TPA: recombinase family protein [Bacillota bacterium]|nr:recombinase family protein [Bacillota bacterium]